MSTAAVSERPAKVVLALRMLYAGIGIGVIRAIVVLRHLEVRTPDFIILVKLVIWAGVLYSIFQTGKGHNWARWLLVSLFIVTIPLNLLPLIPTFTDYPVDGSLGVLQYVLLSIGLGLLFQPNASAWFGKRRGSTLSYSLVDK
jgi:hypothetical protein